MGIAPQRLKLLASNYRGQYPPYQRIKIINIMINNQELITICICPGIHPAEITDSFLEQLEIKNNSNLLVFPTEKYAAYSAKDILGFLQNSGLNSNQSILFISFSAGVVGAFGAALAWQSNHGKIKAFIAIDGWGMPLVANFPIYRLSHDYFTHWSSALLGAGNESFYADPTVAHLELWRSPETAFGWWIKQPGCQIRCNAKDFLLHYLLHKFG